MTYILKPVNHHPNLEKNKLGLTRRDYEGTISTLCAGCGHDSISAAIIEACYDLSLSSDQIANVDDFALQMTEGFKQFLTKQTWQITDMVACL